MHKYIISITYSFLFLISHSFALDLKGRSNFMNVDKLLAPEYEELNDFGYIHFVPQFEENPNPGKASSMEIWFGELDDTPEALEKLKFIQEIIEEERSKDPDIKLAVMAYGPEADTLSNSSQFTRTLEKIGAENERVSIQKLPLFLNYQAKVQREKKARFPSNDTETVLQKLKGFRPGKKSWSFIRFASSMGGAFLGFNIIEGVPATMAAAVTIWPGLASGALTYHSNIYGDFLTNGKWATWLMESDRPLARKFRSAFGIYGHDFENSLSRNKEFFRKYYPDFYKSNPVLFELEMVSLTDGQKPSTTQLAQDKQKRLNLLSKLKHAEEYVKWYLTEVVFTGLAIKLPQTVAGLSIFTGTFQVTSDILWGSLIGTLAQGPGDIAVQVRKYQHIEELKQGIIDKKIHVENSQALLDEIKKIQDPKISYSIHDGSHPKLVEIENRARFKATAFSFFAVSGVAFELAGVPGAKMILGAVAVAGGVYLAKVKGLKNPIPTIKSSYKTYAEKVYKGTFGFRFQDWKTRRCTAAFIP